MGLHMQWPELKAAQAATGGTYWAPSFCLPKAFSTAGEGVSTKLSTLPTSPLPAATRNMAPQVAGTRYSNAGWPMCVIAFAAKLSQAANVSSLHAESPF